MKQKQAFIFFKSSTPHKWERNQEILKLYMNTITIVEENQIEVFSVENVKVEDGLAQRVISSELRLQISLILLKRIHRDTAGTKLPIFISIYQESRPSIFFLKTQTTASNPINCETRKDLWRNEVLHFVWAGSMFSGIFESFKTLFQDGVIKEMLPNVHLTNIYMGREKCVTKETVIDFYNGKVYNSCVVIEQFFNYYFFSFFQTASGFVFSTSTNEQ